jgi:3-oxoadipate enol-lactonase
MPIAQANEIDISYEIDGPEGAPWVTFITGLTNDTTMWSPHIAAIGDRYRMLRLDSRGHGGSQATEPPYLIDLLVADVLGVWDALGIETSAVVGLGLGGITTMSLALAQPDRVTAIIPVSCRSTTSPRFKDIWPPLLQASAEGGIEAIVDTTANRWFPDDFKTANPELMDSVRAMIAKTSVDGYHGCVAALVNTELGDRIEQITVPTLYISGALDRVGAPSELMQAMADQTPGARHVALPDAGHISTMANPRAFEAAVLEFLDSL